MQVYMYILGQITLLLLVMSLEQTTLNRHLYFMAISLVNSLIECVRLNMYMYVMMVQIMSIRISINIYNSLVILLHRHDIPVYR
jgi:hypothetical protein